MSALTTARESASARVGARRGFRLSRVLIYAVLLLFAAFYLLPV